MRLILFLRQEARCRNLRNCLLLARNLASHHGLGDSSCAFQIPGVLAAEDVAVAGRATRPAVKYAVA